MKTYLTFWFYSEGASPRVVVEKLQNMGFKPIKGPYDFVYNACMGANNRIGRNTADSKCRA